ncbi:MAG TPA: hypothetical protein VM577_05785 [Anaerovoracaceae bacterium]|nr:hypothetical protein [Anaerovoracaceae bacterium]
MENEQYIIKTYADRWDTIYCLQKSKPRSFFSKLFGLPGETTIFSSADRAVFMEELKKRGIAKD